MFRSFELSGSACATVRHFREQHLLFPRRVRCGAHHGEIAWGEIQHHDVLRVLHHPAYAGAYAGCRALVRRRPSMERSIFRTSLVLNGSCSYRMLTLATFGIEDYERNEAQLAMNSPGLAPERFSPPERPTGALTGPPPLRSMRRAHDGALPPTGRKTHRA